MKSYNITIIFRESVTFPKWFKLTFEVHATNIENASNLASLYFKGLINNLREYNISIDEVK